MVSWNPNTMRFGGDWTPQTIILWQCDWMHSDPDIYKVGPLLIINWVIVPVNGLINGFPGVKKPYLQGPYFTSFITGSGDSPCRNSCRVLPNRGHMTLSLNWGWRPSHFTGKDPGRCGESRGKLIWAVTRLVNPLVNCCIEGMKYYPVIYMGIVKKPL